MSPALLASCVAVGLGLTANAGVATFTVDSTVDASDAAPGDGVCADVGGHCTLRAAIQEANVSPGADVIILPAGEFVLAIPGTGEDLSMTGDLDVTDDVALRGAGPGSTFIDGDALDRVIDIHSDGEDRSVSLEQLTLRRGMLVNALFDGGAGLRVAEFAHVRLDDIDIRNNETAVSTHGVALEVRGCVEGRRVRIVDNDGDVKVLGSRGTVYVFGNETKSDPACFHLEDSEISGNFAGLAGALYAERASVTLKRSLVSDNESWSAAGAMLFNMDVSVLLENVTVSGNRGSPGAIQNDGFSRLEIVNSTITDNGSGGVEAQVGGILDVHGGSGMTFLSNTILAGNRGSAADDCLNGNSSGGGNIIGDAEGCAQFDAQPNDQLGVLPDMGSLADNGGFTRTHLPGVEAIDLANTANCPPTDQRDQPRPADGDGDGVANCDIGSLERQDAPPDNDPIFQDGFDTAR